PTSAGGRGRPFAAKARACASAGILEGGLRMTLRYSRRLGCLVLVLAGVPAAAQGVCPSTASTWKDTPDTNWNTASNWDPPGVPGNNADVCFSTATPTSFLPGSNVRLRNIYVLAGTTLTLNGTTGSLVVRDGIHSDGTFTFTGGSEDLQVMSPQTWEL